VSYLVLDTDVASGLLRGRLPSDLRGQLVGQTLLTTFVTVGELTKWTVIRHWGPTRRSVLAEFLTHIGTLPYSPGVAQRWGELQAHAQLRGRPRPHNDTWIAACCLDRGYPLATLNHTDFADFAEHEGLTLIR
jgi:predicted nucleic acid-binding protein